YANHRKRAFGVVIGDEPLKAPQNAAINPPGERSAQPQAVNILAECRAVGIGPSHDFTSGTSNAILRRSSVASFGYTAVGAAARWRSTSPITLEGTAARSSLTARA